MARAGPAAIFDCRLPPAACRLPLFVLVHRFQELATKIRLFSPLFPADGKKSLKSRRIFREAARYWQRK